MKKLVVLTGAGISRASGLKTFRDYDGLWENYRIDDVATAEALENNFPLVNEFYNERRRDVLAAEPNEAHHNLKKLEEQYDVHIITQNIDDLHERAGSTNVLHLHGEILKSRSLMDSKTLYPQTTDIKLGDMDSDMSQLRPHVVLFGEDVPNFPIATNTVTDADIFVIIGTSLQVYPASILTTYCFTKRCYIIDPDKQSSKNGFQHICKDAVEGTRELIELFTGN